MSTYSIRRGVKKLFRGIFGWIFIGQEWLGEWKYSTANVLGEWMGGYGGGGEIVGERKRERGESV